MIENHNTVIGYLIG